MRNQGRKRNLKDILSEKEPVSTSQKDTGLPRYIPWNGNLASACYVESVVRTIVFVDIPTPFFMFKTKDMSMEEKSQTSQNQREHGRLKAISETNVQSLIQWGKKKKICPWYLVVCADLELSWKQGTNLRRREFSAWYFITRNVLSAWRAVYLTKASLCMVAIQANDPRRKNKNKNKKTLQFWVFE